MALYGRIAKVGQPNNPQLVQIEILPRQQHGSSGANPSNLKWCSVPGDYALAKVGRKEQHLVGEYVLCDIDPNNEQSVTIKCKIARYGDDSSRGSSQSDQARNPGDIDHDETDFPVTQRSPISFLHNFFNMLLGGQNLLKFIAANGFNIDSVRKRTEQKRSSAQVRAETARVTGADKPTIAAAENNPKTVKQALDEVDPARISEIYKNMHNEFNKISNMLSFSLSAGGGSATPTASVIELLTDALTGALAILVKQYGFERVINFLDDVLGGGKYELIPDEYKPIVKNALVTLLVCVVIYGEKDIPTSELPEIVFGDKIPENLVSSVPDLYVQQFYFPDQDPYPGYIQWEGPDGDLIYTIRGAEDLPFSTTEDYVYSVAKQGLAAALKVYFENEDLIFTVALFVALLIKYCEEIEEKGMDVTVGKNGNNFSGDLTKLLGPVLGAASTFTKSNHIPQSILNQSQLNEALNQFNKAQGRIKQVIKPSSLKAGQIDPSSAISSVVSSIGFIKNLINDGLTSTQISNVASGLTNQLGYLGRIPTNTSLSDRINFTNVNTDNTQLQSVIDNIDSDIGKILDILKGVYS